MMWEHIAHPLPLLYWLALDPHSLFKQKRRQFSPSQGAQVCLHLSNGNHLMCYYFIPLTHLLLRWLYTIFNSFCCWFLLVWSFYILSCSIFETSPPPGLWNVITWQRVISANLPQFWIVGAAFKVPEQVTILWRECFLNISNSSVTGRRSGLLSSSCRLFLVSDMRCYHSIQIPQAFRDCPCLVTALGRILSKPFLFWWSCTYLWHGLTSTQAIQSWYPLIVGTFVIPHSFSFRCEGLVAPREKNK